MSRNKLRPDAPENKERATRRLIRCAIRVLLQAWSVGQVVRKLYQDWRK